MKPSKRSLLFAIVSVGIGLLNLVVFWFFIGLVIFFVWLFIAVIDFVEYKSRKIEEKR